MKVLKIFTVFVILSCTSQLLAFDLKSELKDDFKKYKNQLPGKGVVTDQVEVEGITLKNFKMMGGKKVVKCEPGTEVQCQVDFETDTSKLDPLEGIHYFIVGFHEAGPQETVTSSMGFMNDSGTSNFVLKAPEEKGIYQVRFAHGTGVTFDRASQVWDQNPPSSNTTMGIVIVE